jgi:hypothetical protein
MTETSLHRSLYETDIVTWSERQVAELRRLAATAPSNAIDWDNVIEEIECVGRSELVTVESLLENALLHVLKGVCDPGSLSRVAWSVETAGFLRQARKRYRPSMRRSLEVDEIWQDAFKGASDSLSAHRVSIPPGIPVTCPFTLDEILAESFTYDAAVRRLHAIVTKENPS